MRDTRTPFFLYLLENSLNIGLALGLRHVLGGRGLALSLAIAYSVAAVAALVVLRARVGGLGGFVVVRYVARTVACSLFMAFAVALVLAGVGSDQQEALLALQGADLDAARSAVEAAIGSETGDRYRAGGRTRREPC